MSRLYLDPDETPEPKDRCGSFTCELKECDGECVHSYKRRARAARLEQERLARLSAEEAA